MVSHITLVEETKTPGVKSVAAAATSGYSVNRRAKWYVPSISTTAGNRNAKCSDRSDHPASLPAAVA